jgi:dolichol-phosphate mannosyltransferase
METVDYPWEILFVDDGSSDMTWMEIESLNGRDPRVKGIRLSRNFGHQYALMAGMRACKGDAVITADADLQHPPSLIPKLIEEWEQGNKIVQTVRIESKNIGPFKRFASRQLYRLFGVLSGVDLAPGMSDFRLLDRQVIDDIASFGEQGLFLRGIVQWVGYPRVTVEYYPAERHAGITKYSLSKMVKLAWIGVSSFSNVPLRIGVFAGIFASIVAFAGVGYAIYGKLVSGSAVAGWASSVAIISFLFAILFVYLGILGEYIGRIVTEVRNRPRYLISEQLGISPDLPRSDVIVRPTRSL